jgi:hypothetical protein
MGEPLRKLAVISEGYVDRSPGLSFVTGEAHDPDAETL